MRHVRERLPLLLALLGLALLLACPDPRRTRGRADDDDDASDDDDAVEDDDDAVDDDDTYDGSDLPQGWDAPHEPARATVVDVYDGDTATLDLDDFGQQTVRFLNINTPELAGDECWSEEARDRARELLPEGTIVWLTWDGELEDPYDRLLCHIFRGNHPDEDDWINLQLVEEGHAEAYIFEANDTFEDEFLDAEWAAYQDNLGMWGECF